MYNRFDNRRGKKSIEDITNPSELKNAKERESYKSKVNNINYEWGVDSPTHLELEGIKPTLGFELETIDGAVSNAEASTLNLAAVHDGSLRGPNGEDPEGGEYVTGVMYGDKGFLHLQKICNVLQRNCKIDKRCGVHVHIGSLNWKDEDIVFAYILALMIEQEGFSLLPKSRRENRYCRPLERRGDYLRDLRKVKDDRLQYSAKIEELYNDLFLYVSGGVPQSNNCNKNTNHPRGSKCGYNTSSQRYCWLNFVTLIFDTKGNKNAKTLEIRSHGATMNYSKIKNWTKIWVAFANFVTNNKADILRGHVVHRGKNYPITLETMAMLAYPKGGSKLVDFMRKRKTTFNSKGEDVDYAVDSKIEDKRFSEIIRN